jgi:hypothetical protein
LRKYEDVPKAISEDLVARVTGTTKRRAYGLEES